MTRVTVKAGMALYRSGSTHPFKAGDSFEIDAAEAEQLVKFGHVDLADAPAPVEHASERAPEPEPEHPAEA